jgi:hypothetical protein
MPDPRHPASPRAPSRPPTRVVAVAVQGLGAQQLVARVEEGHALRQRHQRHGQPAHARAARGVHRARRLGRHLGVCWGVGVLGCWVEGGGWVGEWAGVWAGEGHIGEACSCPLPRHAPRALPRPTAHTAAPLHTHCTTHTATAPHLVEDGLVVVAAQVGDVLHRVGAVGQRQAAKVLDVHALEHAAVGHLGAAAGVDEGMRTAGRGGRLVGQLGASRRSPRAKGRGPTAQPLPPRCPRPHAHHHHGHHHAAHHPAAPAPAPASSRSACCPPGCSAPSRCR